jgi:hypothetical protein
MAAMRAQVTSRRQVVRALLRQAARPIATGMVTLALLIPADAQFFDFFGSRPRQPQRQQQQQQDFNPFSPFFSPTPREQQKAQPVDNSRAPAPEKRKADVAPTTPVVVLGDSMADWLAYGLEDAFSEQSDIGIVRKHRTVTGLIRYDPRREVEWPQVVRETIAADKPKYLVMMIGLHDRQSIRERVPARPATTRPGAPAQAPAEATEEQPPAQQEDNPEQPSIVAPEQGRTSATGPFEFRSERWEAAYIRRIDATMTALKASGVPVFWVGLPSQRATRASTDVSYLNDLYRSRAERAGIVYIDIWDGFVDEAGRFALQGPDFEGQIRRLRSGDGIHFTKAGARKLAHFVEREIQRHIANRALPVALPSILDPGQQGPGARPGVPAPRPLAGPVVPLTISTAGQTELLGGGVQRPSLVDPVAIRVLSRGEPINAAPGRADDFSWPRGTTVVTVPAPAGPATATSAAPAAPANTPQAAPAPQRKAPAIRQQPRANTDEIVPRPPRALSPSAAAPQGTVR